MADIQRFKDKGFGWAFWLIAGLVSCGSGWGESVGLGAGARAVCIAVAGIVPLSIQLVTGYGLDGRWRTSFSRSEQPMHYWGSLAASVAAALVMGFGAYRLLVVPASSLAT